MTEKCLWGIDFRACFGKISKWGPELRF